MYQGGARGGAGCISWEDHIKVIGRAHSTSPLTLNVVAPAVHVGVSKVRLLPRDAPVMSLLPVEVNVALCARSLGAAMVKQVIENTCWMCAAAQDVSAPL